MFKISVVYDEGENRYFLPFDIVQKTLKISDSDIEKLKVEVKRQISKGE